MKMMISYDDDDVIIEDGDDNDCSEDNQASL